MKTRVVLLFGGKSGEHEVSLQSATSVMQSIDLQKYTIIPVMITQENEWLFGVKALELLKLEKSRRDEIISQLPTYWLERQAHSLTSTDREYVDVVFPILHGTYGEDGTIQGMFEMLDFPYIGSGVLTSSLAMDKIVSKSVFQQAGLPQASYLWVYTQRLEQGMPEIENQVEEKLGFPCFVKPANLGSSVGISKANDRTELAEALRLAGQYDRKIVIEEFIPAREIEVAVLGNEEPQASEPGEIIFSNDFFDYDAKYTDGKMKIQFPAELTAEQKEEIRRLAVKAFQAVDGSGLARVDFFVRRDNGQILINELNTLPGFTALSVYPKLWEYTGLSYHVLIDRLIELALERYQHKAQLRTTY